MLLEKFHLSLQIYLSKSNRVWVPVSLIWPPNLKIGFLRKPYYFPMNTHRESLIVQEIFMKKIVLAFITVAVMCFGLSQAMAFKPAVVFDMGGKFDKSFNEGIWNGTEKFRKETGCLLYTSDAADDW